MDNTKNMVMKVLTSLVKTKLFWIMIILYIFGIEECLRLMFYDGNWIGGFLPYIRGAYVPLNLVMLPLLFISYKVAKIKFDGKGYRNILEKNKLKVKGIAILIISLMLQLVAIILGIVIAIVSKVDFNYFIYYFGFYFIAVTLFFALTSSLGMFVGIVSKDKKKLDYAILIIIFCLLNTFWRSKEDVLALYPFTAYSGNFYFAEYDIKFFSKIVFWIGILVALVLIMTMLSSSNENTRKKFKVFTVGALTLSLISMILNSSYKVPIYEMDRKREVVGDFTRTYYAKSNIGYYISKYNMNLELNDNIKNECSMNVKITKNNIGYIDLGLYNKLYVSEVYGDDKKLEFNQENNKLTIKFDSELNIGDEILVKVLYEGDPDVRWLQGEKMFFVEENTLFLAETFEWYPKLNDFKEKEYEISIDYSGNNKIYTNLEEKDGVYKGKDKEIYLVSGRINEKEYKGYRLIGNEENFLTDEQCETIVDLVNKEKKYMKNGDSIKDILFVPNMPSVNYIHYKNGYFYAADDSGTRINTKLPKSYNPKEEEIKGEYSQ